MTSVKDMLTILKKYKRQSMKATSLNLQDEQ